MTYERQIRHKPVHGATIGIVMLDTKFQRLPGDIGHAETFPFPVEYKVAKGVRKGALLAPEQTDVLETFLDAANELIDLGVDGITTSCGFLSKFQPVLTERLSVPVATSALLQVPMVKATLPKGKRVGILTAVEDALTAEHLSVVGIDPSTPIAGPDPNGKMRQNSINGRASVDYFEQEKDVLAAARKLVDQNVDIGAIVLECTNFPPYASAIERALGLPVYDVIGMIHWFQRGLRPRRYDVPS
ncbi:aspartate/glutamate racemase family protein [Ensifer sp. YR511]|uniref:aspartate/glutamate racemase family protein n=1 Tax=Ensifer sp. YR511 TaxID=1855294 RepID=UPI000889002B|nr:aspartate/glutamate racemase family protein [Ensifer sp. YR511]SDN42174.1 hypothetical protein SAMN05216328_12647 [Ensifer sp. YR511]